MEYTKNIITNKQLGLIYNKEFSIFRIWSPSRDKINLAIYNDCFTQHREEYEMIKHEDGVFEITINGDLEGRFYTYLIENMEIPDPYSFASSANSKKSAIIDLEKTNPEGFKNHHIPFNDKDKAIIAEAHIADISINENSGAENRGLFLGSSQLGTNFNGYKTGVEHFRELGITHVHFLPVTDYISVNELKPLYKYPNSYNWGYDQELYQNIEGSFSTNPNDPYARIREFKTLVKNYHENGLSVILDVVYNHTFRTSDSIFQVIEPFYFYRMRNGYFADGSGCGNELASERPMVRKFIKDTLKFLVKEYKIDGFRFDLMALTDIDTIKEVIVELREINPNILIYGEPWMALPSPLTYDKQIVIGAQKGNNFAIFNPFFRDSIKGDTDGDVRGYIQGEYYYKQNIENGIAGSIDFTEESTNFSSPLESINYFNAHDNLIFNDKLIKSGVELNELKDVTYIGHAIILLSQGIPFLHAGNSFMRTKYMNHNSYNAPSNINGIDWSLKEKNYDLFVKIKDLITLRKSLGIFNMKTKQEVINSLEFIQGLKDSIIGFKIKKDDEEYIIFINASRKDEKIDFNLFTKQKQLKHFYSDGFIEEIVDIVKLNKYSVNLYKIGG